MKKIVSLILVCSFTAVIGQQITVSSSYTAQQLVENILINNPCIQVSNVSISGGNFTNGEKSYGYFNANSTILPFQEGVLLTTGKLNNAVGPNSNFSDDGGSMGWNGDSDLNTALNLSNTFNATILEFDFVSLANTIRFEYIFASEQYLSNPSPNQCNYTDGFAFLLKEVTASTYQNLAVIPNTAIPVKVNTVRGNGTICPAANAAYFDAFNNGSYPTTFDGQTKMLTAQATVLPNTPYHIKLVIADEGNYRYDSGIFLRAGSFDATKYLGENRLLATNNPLCANETLILDATETAATNYQWFLNGTAISGANNPTYTVTQTGIYSVEITVNTTCIITGQIEIETAPNLILNQTSFSVCDTDTDGVAPFDLNVIRNQLFTNLPSNINIDFYIVPNGSTPLPITFTNTIPFQQTIYALITNYPSCYTPYPIQLTVNTFSTLFPTEVKLVCNNQPIELVAPSGYSNYTWNTNPPQQSTSIFVTNAGTYTVNFTNSNGCSQSKIYLVGTSEIALIEDIETTDFEDVTQVMIHVSGNGIYEYAINGSPFQNTSVFTLTEPGEYTATVNDTRGCGSVSKTFYVLNYPKFFTPNGDSYNDLWQIKNLDKKGWGSSKIYIFDRYGKLLKQLKPAEDGWDGTFNNHNLPATDYWFVLALPNGKTIRSHFTLKR
jgi:gliding motility-associated-like protein